MNAIPLISHEQYEREQFRHNSRFVELWDILDEVKDPEIPVVSIWDLGVLRDVEKADDKVVVTITPTYSGCPAMDAIRQDIEKVLAKAGYSDCQVKTKLAPAWSTDWMSAEGRRNLREYGIAPPEDTPNPDSDITPESSVDCPHCKSKNTTRVSEFGSTACKALFQCRDCGEPFDYFKNI